MSALAAPRSNLSNKGPIFNSIGYKTKATKVFYNGALCNVGTDGYLVPAAATAGQRCVGVVEIANQISKDTTGEADGATTLPVRGGVFPFAIGLTTDALTIADLWNDVYVLDDQTVGRLPGSGRPVAGVLIKIEGSIAYVAVGFPVAHSAPLGSAWQGLGSVEDVAAPGALSVLTHITRLTAIDGTDAFTLAAGLFKGQRKSVIVAVAGTNTPIGTITFAPASTPATVTALGGLGDSWEGVWDGTIWQTVSSFGCTFT